MPISVGFYKKINQWLLNEEGTRVVFRPFLTKGNPYKSRIFLISSNAVPFFKVEDKSEQIYAESLVNRELFAELYRSELLGAPREFKGSLQFEQWLEQQHGEALVYTSLNTYQLETTEDAKIAKKEDAVNFERGQAIFKEVLEEFQPEVLVLQGTAAFNQFKSLYTENLVICNPAITKVQLLEEAGPFAEMHYANGKKVVVFVTRSMGSFGNDGTKFERFKENLVKLL